MSEEQQMLRHLGFFGHYLHVHRGGRSGKQHVLAVILEQGGHTTQRELQEQSCITSASLSEVLAKLECEGLVMRQRFEGDRRQLTIALTPEGEARAREVIAEREDFERNSMSVLTAEEKEQLLDMLSRLEEHWVRLEEEKRGVGSCCRK